MTERKQNMIEQRRKQDEHKLKNKNQKNKKDENKEKNKKEEERFPVEGRREVKRENKQFSINERKRTEILQARLKWIIFKVQRLKMITLQVKRIT